MKKADNQLLVIFGASGDLTSRKLLPSLFELYVRGLLPDRFCILGAARTAYGDEEFRAEQHTHILEAQKGKTYDEGLIDDFLENVYYLAFDSRTPMNTTNCVSASSSCKRNMTCRIRSSITWLPRR